MAGFLKCEGAKLPFNYLGIPVGANMSVAKNWKPIVEKVSSRLSSWKAKTLSFGGRATLCKSILGSIPLYALSLFRAPLKVIDSMEKIRRKFLWGSTDNGQTKFCWVKWQKVTAPKKVGGLGIGSLWAANTALLVKWWWRYMKNRNALWANIIGSLHGTTGAEVAKIAHPKKSGVWLNIVKAGNSLRDYNINLEELITKVVGNGQLTRFWSDRWYNNSTLKALFPDLYDCDSNKDCWVAERIPLPGPGFSWAWSTSINSNGLQNRINEPEDMLNGVKLTEKDDEWWWRGDATGAFSVKSLRLKIDNMTNSPFAGNMLWGKWLPPKVKCFVWRLLMNRVPTRKNPSSRGIQVPNITCPLCGFEEETVEHLFYSYPVSKEIWGWLLSWCELDQAQHCSLDLFLFKLKDNAKSKKQRKILEVMAGGAFWHI